MNLKRVLAGRPVALLLAALALALGAAHRLRLAPPPDNDPYFARVRTAAFADPPTVDGLRPVEAPVPEAAINMLRPNVLLSRAWRPPEGTEDLDAFATLFVHCGDMRDLFGHYPPNCYPGVGWTLVGARPVTIEVPGLPALTGVEYRFDMPGRDDARPMRVANVFLAPGVAPLPDFRALQSTLDFASGGNWGAAQLQVLVPESLTDDERAAAYGRAARLHEPAIRAVLADPRDVPSPP